MKDSLIFPKEILNQHLVVLGKTGAGKSSALRHIVEHLLRQQKRVCIIDPKGDWCGLKVSADGAGAGFPVILFGSFKEPIPADVPLNEYSGKHIAELVTSGNRPCVVGFRGWTQGHMTKFWIDFASTLFNSNAGELYLVVDEVHNFAPKGKILSPEAGMCLHWSNRIMNEGRGIGLVNLIASQRPQKVHNDTLTACETLVAMRVVHKSDRDAVEDWIKGCGDAEQGKEVLNSLAGMSRGEAFAWSPEAQFGPVRLKFPMFSTFDSFAPPQLQKKVSEKDWASVDLTEVKARLAAVIEEQKANDPKELRKKIIELERQLNSRASVVDQAAIDKAVKDIEKQYQQIIREREQSFNDLLGRFKRVEDLGRKIVEAAHLNGDAPKPLALPERMPVAAQAVPRRVTQPIAARAPAPVITGGDFQLSKSQQRILNALAWLEGIGVNQPSKIQLALMSNHSPTSGGYFNSLGNLRSAGLVEYPMPACVALTPSGRGQVYISDVPTTNDALHDQIYRMLSSPQASILRELIGLYPDSITKGELAERLGVSPTSGGYFNNLGKLRSLGLVGYPQAGSVAALPVLFIE